jgi:tight adherence protein B
MLFILIGVLGFVTIAGLGFALAGGDRQRLRQAAKRAQMIVGGGDARRRRPRQGRRQHARRPPQADPQDAEGAGSPAEEGVADHRRAPAPAGLGENVQMFWIVSGVHRPDGRRPHPAGSGPDADRDRPGRGLRRRLRPAALGGRHDGQGRTKKFTEAFSDAIDIIVRGIKSGLPVHDCLKIIGKECPEPLAGEFRMLTENVGMGMPMDEALERMYERMPTNELRFFAIVLAIQAKTGGNLAEALGNLSTVLRARKLMGEKIKALSAEAVASAFIIGCLPPGVVVLITVTSPAYMQPLFTDPRGHLMLLAAASG